MTSTNSPWLTVIAPSSVSYWYKGFARSESQVIFPGETESGPLELCAEIEAKASGKRVRIYSGHDSLLRDWATSLLLCERGFEAQSQTGMAVAAGLDKILQKRLLGLEGIEVPDWGSRESDLPVEGRILVKMRGATQSRGLSWAGSGAVAGWGSYWESFVAGLEYSVVVHCSPGGATVFPPVWKGRVREDLVPPWQRCRLLPSGLGSDVARTLQEIAARVCRLIDAWGFVEVEFIVPDAGHPLVVDVNPRISGTMRISGMATETPLFDMFERPVDGVTMLPPTRFAAEIPYAGTPFTRTDVIATSRITCAGDSPAQVLETLVEHGYAAGTSDWPEVWLAD